MSGIRTSGLYTIWVICTKELYACETLVLALDYMGELSVYGMLYMDYGLCMILWVVCML